MSTAARGASRRRAIRESHGPCEGHALSLFHLGLTLEALSKAEGESTLEEARFSYKRAAEKFDRLGKADSAAVTRKRLQMAVLGNSADL